MFDSIRCYVNSSRCDIFNNFILIAAGLVITIYALVANIVASVGIWRLYRRHMKRTPKLLLSLFATNLLTASAVASLYLYHFIEEFLQSWFFSVHLSIIAFSISWSSTIVLMVTLDRFLLVVRGNCYLYWKKNFCILTIVSGLVDASWSMYFYFGLKYLGCVTNLINLAVFGAILLINLILSLFTNIAMMRYVRKNVSLIGSTRVNMRNEVANTVFAMTMSSTCCQIVLISLLVVFVSSFAIEMAVAKYGGILIVLFIIFVLFNCGTIPLTYIVGNSRMLNTLRCENA